MKRVLRAVLSMIFVFAALCAITLVASGDPAPALKTSKTLQNLQAAYNGESNAHAKYLLFAQKADEEGYGEAASLFRAASRAEEIHLTNHAAVIRELGAEPQARVETPAVKSTRENLEDSANQGEAYERDTMYPKFIKQAKLENVPSAVQSFEYARAAEAQHFKLFTEALNNLENLRGKSRTYYVCSICGFTSTEKATAECAGCPVHKEKYEAIN
jgi:rubrerythrin